MAGVLIRMHLRVMRNSLTGWRLVWLICIAVLGVAAAAATLSIAFRALDGVEAPADVLAVTLFAWTAGWMTGAVLAGGGGEPLRPEQFALLPVSARRLTTALLAASFVNVGPAVTLLAFSALVIYAARLGPVEAMVAVPAVVLQVALVVMLARTLGAVLAVVVRGRVSAALAALPWAVGIASMGQTRFFFEAAGTTEITASSYTPLVYLLPSGWSVAAVEAAHRSDWLTALAALGGLVLLAGALVLAWASLLRRRLTAGHASVQPVGAGSGGPPALAGRLLPGGAVGAVAGKELRTWPRDLIRLHFLAWGMLYGIAFCLLPLVAGDTTHLPWIGVAVAVMGSAACAHLYSSDGTGLWLTLAAPGGEAADVRGRQVAWLLGVGPLVLVLTVAALLIGWDGGAVPWVLAIVPAVLGAAAGLIPLVSLLIPLTMVDAHRRSGNPNKDGGNPTGVIWLMLLLLLLSAAPAAAVVGAGEILESTPLRWAGVPTGFVTGGLLAWGLGRVAIWRLQSRGPELLHRLRSGPASHKRGGGANEPVAVPDPAAEPWAADERRRKLMAIAFISTAWLPTKVWGLVPAAIKLSGADGPAWLLIFRLPGELQWPVIIGAIALGLAMYATAARLGWSIRQSRLARERSRGGRGPVPPLQRQNVV